MSGFDNEVLYSIGQRLEPSTSQAIGLMQKASTDVSIINHIGDPEGVVSANPSSLSHDPVSGNLYLKQTGTGTTGWILIGSSSLPSPAKVLSVFDDFLSSSQGSSSAGNLLWLGTNVLMGTGTSTHPGILHFPFSPGSFSYLQIANFFGIGVDTGSFVLGGGIFSLNFVLKLNALSNNTDTYNMLIGLCDFDHNIVGPAFPPNDGVFFTYTNSLNSGNWQIVTDSATVRTTTNTSVVADTNWHNFGIVINASATSVSYTIDGVSVGTITTNIPTGPISPFVYHNPTAGTPLAFDIDLFYATLTLTTSR